jgi:hypothetical protein
MKFKRFAGKPTRILFLLPISLAFIGCAVAAFSSDVTDLPQINPEMTPSGNSIGDGTIEIWSNAGEAYVTIKSLNDDEYYSGTTDSSGYAIFRNLPTEREYEIKITKLGYNPYIIVKYLLAGSSLTIRAQMGPAISDAEQGPV